MTWPRSSSWKKNTKAQRRSGIRTPLFFCIINLWLSPWAQVGVVLRGGKSPGKRSSSGGEEALHFPAQSWSCRHGHSQGPLRGTFLGTQRPCFHLLLLKPQCRICLFKSPNIVFNPAFPNQFPELLNRDHLLVVLQTLKLISVDSTFFQFIC